MASDQFLIEYLPILLFIFIAAGLSVMMVVDTQMLTSQGQLKLCLQRIARITHSFILVVRNDGRNIRAIAIATAKLIRASKVNSAIQQNGAHLGNILAFC